MLYAFFWVIPRCLNFICQHFGTLSLFHLHRQVDVKNELGLRNVRVFIREKVWLFSSQTFSLINTPTLLKPSSFFTPTWLWRWDSVPKRWHIKFRRRGITQKRPIRTLCMYSVIAISSVTWNITNVSVLNYLKFHTSHVQKWHIDMLFLFNISSGSKCCLALLETLSLHVSNQNLRDSPLFKIDITCHNWPSTICALMAYDICRDIGIFSVKSALFNS